MNIQAIPETGPAARRSRRPATGSTITRQSPKLKKRFRLRAAAGRKRDGLAGKICSAPDWRITTRPRHLPEKPVRGFWEAIPPAGAQSLCNKKDTNANFIDEFCLHSLAGRRINGQSNLVIHKNNLIEIAIDLNRPVEVL